MGRKVISIPPTYFYICIVFNIATLFVPGIEQVIKFPINLLGTLIMILGVYMIGSTHYYLKRYNTAENFNKSTHVIENGLYKYSRNPMYLGALIFLTGLAVLIGTILGFVSPMFMFVVFNFMFIPYEEEKMKKELGEKYLIYKTRVRRWI